jgi:hypothetical protein
MNNKSDKKRKRKQKQNQSKTKKKTTSRQSKKKIEIKTGGVWQVSNGSYNPTTLAELQQPLLPKSNRLANEPRANSRILSQNVSQTQPPANLRNSQQTVSQAQSPPPPPPPRPPNAQPSGTNTIISISRCSIM